MPRPLALIVLLFLPERRVEAIQSLAACSIKLEGRLPADCTLPAYDYGPLLDNREPSVVLLHHQPGSLSPGRHGSNAPTNLTELIEHRSYRREIVKTAVPGCRPVRFPRGLFVQSAGELGRLGNTVCYNGLGDIEGCPNLPLPTTAWQGSGTTPVSAYAEHSGEPHCMRPTRRRRSRDLQSDECVASVERTCHLGAATT